MTRRAAAAVAAMIAALALALSLTGCTVTVTAKKHDSWTGWYYLCDGPQPLPCRNGYTWRVTPAEYNAARVGQSYSIG